MQSINEPKPSFFKVLSEKTVRFYRYCAGGVWTDTRRKWWVSVVKTINLTVRNFMNPDFQNLAAAMTYRTVLAVVPVLALLFAICRGFGFENLLQTQLYHFFPSQQKAIGTALHFVDSYLNQASEGIFVGVGILFLLWTVVSLLRSVEQSFNIIWGIKHDRSLWRQITDYMCIFIVLPTLIICSSGINVIFDTALRTLLPPAIATPLFDTLFTLLSVFLTWLTFTGAYMLIPNAKVRFRNAFIAGMLAGTAYVVLQWLFVTGQMYVSKYNAIYGSFSFLPLLLIWLQLVWMFTFIGATVCFASQNFDRFNYQNQISKISSDYKSLIQIAILSVIATRFKERKPALNAPQICDRFSLPIKLVEECVDRLLKDGLVINVLDIDGTDRRALVPALDTAQLDLGYVISTLGTSGDTRFIPKFDSSFRNLETVLTSLREMLVKSASGILLTDIKFEEQ